MTKKYQRAEFDTSKLAVPEQVRVVMEEIAADMGEGLLALAVGAGLQVMGQLMDAEVAAVCGLRGKHDTDRAATRHGTERGSVTLGGRRVPVTRPGVRALDGTGEVPVARLRAVQLHRAAREDGNGTDAGRGLNPPLPGRLGAGRSRRPGGGEVDQQVRGVAEVRRDDRARLDRPACPPTCPGWTWSR